MATKKSSPARLTLQDVKKLFESQNVAVKLHEVLDGSLSRGFQNFSCRQRKENIKRRATLPDGVSKIICMVTEKAYNQM